MSHHLLISACKRLYSLRPLFVTALTASLLACGGGRSDLQNTGLQGQPVAGANRAGESFSNKGTSKSAAASQANSAIPLDTDQACTEESDYLESIDPERTLVSRHVDCRKVSTNFTFPREVYADLFQNEDGSFRYATLQEINDRVPQYTSVVVGRVAKIEAQMALYGPSNGLNKTYKTRMRGMGFTADPDYRGPSTAMEAIEVRLRFACRGLTDASTCTYPERKVSISTNGQWSDITEEFAITFNWPAPADPQQNDLETFRLNTDRLYFHAKGSVDRGDGNGSANFFSLDDSAVQVRCDRNVAEQGTQGCVLPLAAPVYELKTTDVATEATEHIREAQANGSPGNFLMKAGTRAVADESVTNSTKALQRLKNAGELIPSDPNRAAACERSNSLINVRPQYSRSCTPATPGGEVPTGCQCDEYPFNSSYQGAAYLPDLTSVRYINATENNNAGGVKLKTWYKTMRVLDLGSGRETGLPSANSSDFFWVKPLNDQ